MYKIGVIRSDNLFMVNIYDIIFNTLVDSEMCDIRRLHEILKDYKKDYSTKFLKALRIGEEFIL